MSTRNCRAHTHQKSCMVTTTGMPRSAAASSGPTPRPWRAWAWTTSGSHSASHASDTARTPGLSWFNGSSQPMKGPMATHRTATPTSSVVSQVLSGVRSGSRLPASTRTS